MFADIDPQTHHLDPESVILPGVTIGEESVVGALCLVAKDLEPFAIDAGSPLKRIKARSQRLLALWVLRIKGKR